MSAEDSPRLFAFLFPLDRRRGAGPAWPDGWAARGRDGWAFSAVLAFSCGLFSLAL